MLAPKPSLKLLVTTTSLALLLNVAVFSWADKGPKETALPKLKDSDWKPLWNRLETDGPESAGAIKVLEKLKEAFDTHEVPQALSGVKSMVSDLIEARQTLRIELCTDDKIKAFNKEEFANFLGHPRLHTYMLNHKRNYIMNCLELIFHDLGRRLSTRIKNNQPGPYEMVAELGNVIRNSQKLDIFDVARTITNTRFTAKQLTEALFVFLDRCWRDRKPLQRLPVDELYNEHIVKPCKDWVPATERVRGLYKYVDEPYVKWWMWRMFANGHLCRHIQLNNEAILASLH